MKNFVENIEEIEVLKNANTSKKESFVLISYKSTPNKQAFIEGSKNTEFVIVDVLNEKVVGEGKTNKEGQAICVCEYINSTVTARLK